MAVSAVSALAALTALSGCTTAGTDHHRPGTPVAHTSGTSASHSPDAPRPAVITTKPATTAPISPITPVQVSVAAGKLTTVTMVNDAGKAVTGTLAADGSSWHSTEVLGYGKTYTVTATATNSAGAATVKKAEVRTLTPANMTMPYLQRPGGYSLDKGTYGVGIVPVVHFDEHITDKKAAEQTLSVTTSPHVDGSWNWVDDQDVHWRPQNYFAPGTKVTVTAKVYGKQVSPGLYGQDDKSVSFTIGAKHVTVANAKTHQVTVTFDDKLMRTMPTSMGQGGYVSGKNGQQIALWTMPGTYTVLAHENPAIMSSDSYGLPANSPLGYAPEKIYWATKISTDGIYLHELDATVWAQGHQNVSHGCLNLNHDNAQWYYQHAQIGDIVQVVQSGGPGIKIWQGGDWSVPWATWQAGSALH